MKPRELTVEEVRNKFLKHCRLLVDYWDKVEDRTTKEKISGAIFSVLAMLDGSNIDLPGFIVAPRPHENDKKFCKKEGENWYPENHKSNIKCDIGGSLHEMFH